MRILEEFWYGNIRPNEREFKRETQLDELLRLLVKNEEKLIALLTEQEKGIFENYQACQSELTQISECETFISGFRLGAKIMLEVMTEPDGCFTEITG